MWMCVCVYLLMIVLSCLLFISFDDGDFDDGEDEEPLDDLENVDVRAVCYYVTFTHSLLRVQKLLDQRF